MDRFSRAAAVVSNEDLASMTMGSFWESEIATERVDLPGQVGQKVGAGMTREGSKDPQQDFALCMRVEGELMELCLEMGDGSAGSCWVTLREQSNAAGAIYHRLTVKEKGDEAFFGQQEEATPEKGILFVCVNI